MSKFLFTCPQCNQQLKAEEEWLGMQCECPCCKQSIIIEKPQEMPAVALQAVVSAEKPCPFCGQLIKNEAVFCKHCKRDLTGASSETAEEKTFPFICPDCDTFAELPLSMLGQPYECKACAETHDAVQATGRKCPYCREEIKIQATICRYCRKPVPPLKSGSGLISAAKEFFGNRPSASQPVTQQPATHDQVSSAPMFWGITEEAVQNIRALFFVWLGGECILLILQLLSMLFVATPALTNINIAIAIGMIVVFCMLFYKYWKQVPATEAETTPGKAVGFLFIPIFQFYWFVVMTLKLSAHYGQFDDFDIKVTKIAASYVNTWIGSIVLALIIGILTGLGYDTRIAQWFVNGMSFCSAVLGIAWMFRMQKCAQNIPRIG